MSCLFCKIIAGLLPSEKLYEDEHLLVIKDKFPKAKTHILLMPKKHIPTLREVTSADLPLMAYLIEKVPSIATLAGLEDFRLIINNGSQGGQEIFHLHVHILGSDKKLPGF